MTEKTVERLNERAWRVVERVCRQVETLRIRHFQTVGGARVVDFGLTVPGGLQAGLELARICLADLGHVQLVWRTFDERDWPHVEVRTDCPVEACLFSQYAGWQLSLPDFFAIGSGPARAAAGVEELFDRLGYRERPGVAVAVLETAQVPDEPVARHVAEAAGVPLRQVALAVASASSLAGTVQVVARTVETALHKLYELDFDLRRVRSAYGIAPLPPVAGDDLQGLARTNDAILYGGCVTLWVDGENESLRKVGPLVPSCSSSAYGRPFRELFEEAGRDFYQMDPYLFSPASVTFVNVETGDVFRFGEKRLDVLRQSFGL